MAIIDSLLYRSADPHAEGHLPPDELLRRLVARFPLAAVDRERGDQIVRDHAVRLEELSAASVVVDDWRSLAGRVADVTVRGEEGRPAFGFLLVPNPGLIEIVYERAACRPLLEALAAELEYDILTEDSVEEDLDD